MSIVEGDSLKIRKSFLWLAVGLILLSVVSAVYGYQPDTGRYRLDIVGVRVASDESVRMYLVNPEMEDFDFTTLHSYSVLLDGEKETGKFSHSFDQPLAVVGTLTYGEKMGLELPGKELKCGWPLTVEMYTYKGQLIARYVGIPPCDIEAPRRSGLTKLDYCSAEYDDGHLKIKWELVDADEFAGKVKLRKTVGKLAPEEDWYDMGFCPDLESGTCKTEIEYILFDDEDGVSVKIVDRREGTSVVLNNHPERPCFRSDQVVVVATDADGNTEDVGEIDPVGDTYLLEADASDDVRVCLEGCKAEGQCFMEETRARYMGMDVYCKGDNWLVQKVEGKSCNSDYECKSEICAAGTCSSERVESEKGWLTRFLEWMDNLI